MGKAVGASRVIQILSVLILSLLLSTSQLLASDAAGGAKKGLLDPDMETFIYTVVVFVLAFLVLKKKAWGPIAIALDERDAKIRESLEAADRMRVEQQAFQAEQDIKTKVLSEIDQAKEKAVDEINTRAIDLSISISEKLIGHSVTGEDHERIARETISEYEKIN